MAEPAAEASAETEQTTRGLDRLVFFSDAVMAIALTLLAIDLPLPPSGESNRESWHQIGTMMHRDYLTFAITFLVITVFWTSHHRFFQRVRRLDTALVWLNMLFLFAIVVLPYASRLHGQGGPGSQPGTVIYAATVALVGASLAACVIHAKRAGLLETGWNSGDMIQGLIVPTAAFAISIPIAFASTSLAQWAWLVLSVGGLQLARVISRMHVRRH